MSKYVDTVAVENQAAMTWDTSPAVRTEFSGNKAAYIAYWKAVARGQTAMKLHPNSPKPGSATQPAPAQSAHIRPAAVIARTEQRQQATATAHQLSKMAGIRAFYSQFPDEARKQYPTEVKQIEGGKVHGFV